MLMTEPSPELDAYVARMREWLAKQGYDEPEMQEALKKLPDLPPWRELPSEKGEKPDPKYLMPRKASIASSSSTKKDYKK